MLQRERRHLVQLVNRLRGRRGIVVDSARAAGGTSIRELDWNHRRAVLGTLTVKPDQFTAMVVEKEHTCHPMDQFDYQSQQTSPSQRYPCLASLSSCSSTSPPSSLSPSYLNRGFAHITLDGAFENQQDCWDSLHEVITQCYSYKDGGESTNYYAGGQTAHLNVRFCNCE
ncbi:hypothetical protein C8Q73DRAFT_42153 [Cubamyces lactineus]|nr:hypothetical protein C8Q73DRAFT_42153 [Cubamyces lactineus]